MNSRVVTGNIEVFILITWTTRAHLHQASELMLQLCDDANDTILIENTGVAPDWTCNPFYSDSFVFIEKFMANVIA